jgi:hypothetical protein
VLQQAHSIGFSGKSQTPPDLVVKSQPVDIVAVILWPILSLYVVYQREIEG